MRSRLIALIAISLLLAGCTTQMTSVVSTAASGDDAPRNGASYRLARLSYGTTITRTLTACPDQGKGEVAIELAAAVTPSIVAGEELLVDYTDLAKGWKTTDFTFTPHPNGVLKTVNAVVTSQEAAGVKAAVSSVVGIAKLIIGAPSPMAAAAAAGVPLVPGQQLEPQLECSALGKTYVSTLATRETTRDAAIKKRDLAKATLDAFDADHAGAPLSDDAKGKRVPLATAARTAEEAAKKAAEAYTKARELLSVQTNEPINSDMLGIQRLKPGAAVGVLYAKLLQVSFTRNGAPVPALTRAVPASLDFGQLNAEDRMAQLALKSLIDRSTITADLRTLTTPLANAAIGAANVCGSGPKQKPCGILYRPVTPIRLQLCEHADDLRPCGDRQPGDKMILVRDERNGPQFGGLRSLPLVNKPFEGNSLVATFREDSSLETVHYIKPNAGGVVMLGAMGEVIDGVTQIDAYSRGKKTRQIDNRTALAKARTESENADAALYEAQIKAREAREKLAAANAADGEDQ